MVDLQGRAIYYSIHSNSTFGDFIKQNGLLDPAKLRAFDPNKSFPVNTLTLKAAWKVVAPGEDVSTFYTRAAQIALLTIRNGKIALSRKTKPAKVALVGFHIGGAVNGHPEMIWATFEHVRNAPDLPKPVNQMAPDEIVSDKGWTFYKASTRFRDCNINSAGAGALKLNETQQTLSPVTQVCRIIPSGGGSATNVGNIKSMNNSVHSQLKDVFNNYFEVGAIWFNGSERAEAELHVPARCRWSAPPNRVTPLLTGLDPIVEHHGRDLHAGAERAEQLLRLPQHRAGHVAEHDGAVIAGPQRRHQPRADQQIFRRRIQGEAEGKR